MRKLFILALVVLCTGIPLVAFASPFNLSGEWIMNANGWKFLLTIDESGNKFEGTMAPINNSNPVTRVSGAVHPDGRIDFQRFSPGSTQQYDGRIYQGIERNNGMAGYFVSGAATFAWHAERRTHENISLANWSGVWSTNWGRMELQQVGDRVTGHYTHDRGRINAKIVGNQLIGKWSEADTYHPPNDAGDIEFTLSSDGRSFTGKWRYGSSGSWSDGWTGEKQQ